MRRRAVAEYQAHTSPRMRVRNFNIAGVAWSNVKLGININRRIAIINFIPSIDVVKVGAGIHIAVVELKGAVRIRGLAYKVMTDGTACYLARAEGAVS